MNILDEVAIRYYQWAKDDFQREIREDYPLLRQIKHSYLQFRQLPILQSLKSEKQQLLVSALLKRFHRRAVLLLEESILPLEQAMLDWYDEKRREIPSIEFPYRELELVGEIPYKVNRKKFRARLQPILLPILGAKPEKWDGGVWRYEQVFGDLSLYTFIDTGGQYHQLTYEHLIGPKGRPELAAYPAVGIRCISVLGWLGLSSQTMWNMLTDANVEETTQTLALFCSHFVKALENILDGFESV